MTIRFLSLFSIILFLSGCATNPPKETYDNVCAIYDHDSEWESGANKSTKRWGVPQHTLMAIVHQESRFKHDAQPPRDYALGIIPLPRRSSAYGYPQAQDPAWHDYKKATGRSSARRTDITDSLDFIGWYTYQAYKRNGVSRTDAYNLYLSYHEGHGGFKRKSYRNKTWLKAVAKKVQKRAVMYKKQLKRCDKYVAPPKSAKKSSTKKSSSCNAPWPFC